MTIKTPGGSIHPKMANSGCQVVDMPYLRKFDVIRNIQIITRMAPAIMATPATAEIVEDDTMLSSNSERVAVPLMKSVALDCKDDWTNPLTMAPTPAMATIIVIAVDRPPIRLTCCV